MQTVLFEVFHRGTLGKKLLGSLTLEESDINTYSPGIYSEYHLRESRILFTVMVSFSGFSRPLITTSNSISLEISFSLNISLPEGIAADSTPSPVHDIVVPATVQAAAEATATISDPGPLVTVSNTADAANTIESAHTTAENVAAYYVPMGEAQELIDKILNLVETGAKVRNSKSNSGLSLIIWFRSMQLSELHLWHCPQHIG
jgi:hypothetical protein